MDGDLGRVPELCALAEEFGAIMMVDDAHASGVFGKQRQRHRRSLRLPRPRRHPGRHAVEGDRRARRLRRRHEGLHRVSAITARGRSCSPPRIRRRSPPRASRRSTCSKPSRSGWSSCGTTPASSRPACNARLQHRPQRKPDHAGDRRRGRHAAKMSDTLFERGVFAQSIGFPTVARDKARLRTIVTATHTEGRPAICARHVRQGRAGNSGSSKSVTVIR